MASSKLWFHGSRIVRHILQPGRPVPPRRYFVEYIPCEGCGSAIVKGAGDPPHLCRRCWLEDAERQSRQTGGMLSDPLRRGYYEDAVAFILIVGAAIVLLLWWLV